MAFFFLYSMKKMIAFRTEDSLKSSLFTKAEEDGVSVNGLLNLLAQAYVDGKIDIGVVPGNSGITPIKV